MPDRGKGGSDFQRAYGSDHRPVARLASDREPHPWSEMPPDTCDFIGHEWLDSGGGLLICGTCRSEKWA